MKVLIIYDNVSCAIHANAVLHRAAYRADVAVKWNISPWRLNMLKSQSTAGRVLHDAVDAHLIIFAVRRHRGLPVWLIDWLRQWVSCRLTLEAALAIIGDGTAEASVAPATIEMSGFARQNGLSFIFNNHGDINDEAGFLDLGRRRENTSLLMPIFAKPPSGIANGAWGIND